MGVEGVFIRNERGLFEIFFRRVNRGQSHKENIIAVKFGYTTQNFATNVQGVHSYGILI